MNITTLIPSGLRMEDGPTGVAPALMQDQNWSCMNAG